jgi:hypothetical protein
LGTICSAFLGASPLSSTPSRPFLKKSLVVLWAGEAANLKRAFDLHCIGAVALERDLLSHPVASLRRRLVTSSVTVQSQRRISSGICSTSSEEACLPARDVV